MNKSILNSALAATLLIASSCTSTVDEGIANTNAISFGTVLTNSRALDGIGDLNKFYVYGSVNGKTIFNDQVVTRSDDATNLWTYTYNAGDEAPKWVAGATHHFYAYSADNGEIHGIEGKAVYTPGGKLTFQNVYAGAPDSNFDLIYAEAEQVGLMSGNSKVALRFKHIFSQINVIFQNATQNDAGTVYNVKINSTNFANCEVMGNFDGEKWTEPDDSTIPGNGLNGTPLYFLDTNATSTGFFGLGESVQTVAMYEIPYDYTYEPIVLRFSITLTNANNPADTKTKIFQANFNPKWEMGYRYNYTVPVSLALFESDEYIHFTVTDIDNWNDGVTEGTLDIEEVF